MLSALQFHFLVHYFGIEGISYCLLNFSLFSLTVAHDWDSAIFISVCGYENFTTFCHLLLEILVWFWGHIEGLDLVLSVVTSSSLFSNLCIWRTYSWPNLVPKVRFAFHDFLFCPYTYIYLCWCICLYFWLSSLFCQTLSLIIYKRELLLGLEGFPCGCLFCLCLWCRSQIILCIWHQCLWQHSSWSPCSTWLCRQHTLIA